MMMDGQGEGSRGLNASLVLPMGAVASVGNRLRPFARSRRGLVGFILLIMLISTAVATPILAPYDPNKSDLDVQLNSPSLAHPLGTDELGRDVLSRVIYGARISIYVAIVAAGIAAVAGSLIGLTVGYIGGFSDTIVMRCFLLAIFTPLSFRPRTNITPGPVLGGQVSSRRGLVGFILLIMLISTAVATPILAPYDPNKSDLDVQLIHRVLLTPWAQTSWVEMC